MYGLGRLKADSCTLHVGSQSIRRRHHDGCGHRHGSERADSGAGRRAIGGPGGGDYRIGCGVGRFVVGLTGRAGDWMDQVAPICVKIDGYGHWTEAPSPRPSAGGSGGGAFTTLCPRDTVVTGYYGYAQKYVINIGLTCRSDGPDGTTFKPTIPALVGGSLGVSTSQGGGCGNGNAANGIIGRAGVYVDRFGLSCAGYLVAPPPVASQPPPVIDIPSEKLKQKNTSVRKALGRFDAPTIDGNGVDICLHWGTSCGAPAADEFCRRNGFAASTANTVRNDAPPTLVLGDNAVCNDATCDRFSQITCQ